MTFGPESPGGYRASRSGDLVVEGPAGRTERRRAGASERPADPVDARRPRRSRLPRLVGLLALALALAAAFWLYRARQQPAERPAEARGGSRPGGEAGGGPPQTVRVATIGKGDMPIDLAALGTVTSLATVSVRPQVSGQIVQVAFTEGQLVRKGDFLAQIDPRPYQIALEQAQAQLARDQALLRNAQDDLARYQRLNAQDSIARQQVDTQLSLTRQYEATLQTDQAQIHSAELNLAYAHVTAPVDGRVGLRQVDEGNYVQAGDASGLVVITQLRPTSVIFTLPGDQVGPVMDRLAASAALPVAAFDRTNTRQVAQGTLATVDNQIDATTGTVRLRAIFPNDDGALFPNQFVNARLLVDTRRDATIVPTAAVQRGAPGTFAYVVGADDKVTVRPVRLGPGEPDRAVVESGLEVGEKVVVDGLDRLRDGARVTLADAAAAPTAGAPEQQPGQGRHRRP